MIKFIGYNHKKLNKMKNILHLIVAIGVLLTSNVVMAQEVTSSSTDEKIEVKNEVAAKAIVNNTNEHKKKKSKSDCAKDKKHNKKCKKNKEACKKKKACKKDKEGTASSKKKCKKSCKKKGEVAS